MPRRRDYMGGNDLNIDEGNGKPAGVDQWGNGPSGYVPGQDLGMAGAGGASESPRERASMMGGVGNLPEAPQPRMDSGGGGPEAPVTSTPRRPSTPAPATGATFEAGPSGGGAPSGVMPFEPMGGPDAVSQASPKLRGLYGSQGGLQGGGLGVPGAASPATNDPLSLLIQQLLMNSGG